MPNPAPANSTPTRLQRVHSPGAAFLSYLVPGLGQIYQGRIGKGLLFMLALYTLFFYGMYLGNWCNVYLPNTPEKNRESMLPRFVLNLYNNRLQFTGQFWIGAA